MADGGALDLAFHLLLSVGPSRELTSPATANRYLALIRAILRRACRVWGWLKKFPVIALYPEPVTRVRFLTPEQAHRLITALPEHQKDVVRFALATGLRHGNIVGLQWNQVDLRRRMAWIEADQAKARQPLHVPLNAWAMEILERQDSEASVRVFTYRGKPIKRVNTRAWKRAVKQAGIGSFRFHDLRHTWASWHAQNGTPMYVLQVLGGWRSEIMVKRYAHLAPSHFAHYAEVITPLRSSC